ncbi:MAG: lactate racemase domain-containing protein [Flavisolibacter sp.]
MKADDAFKRYLIPWDAWHESEHATSEPSSVRGKEIYFPRSWDVRMVSADHAPAASNEAIAMAIARPIGTQPLAQLARGAKTVAIAVDDLTRPANLQPVVDLLLEKLEHSGIERRQVRIIFGVGVHGPVEGDDIVKKIGHRAITGVEIVSHDARGEMMSVALENGKSIAINSTFMSSDLKIVIGTVMPHFYAGYSGGAKMIVPGLAGIDTIVYTHKSALMGLSGKLRQVEGNRFRKHIEIVGKAIGVAFSIQLVVNFERQLAGVFAGDIVAAHRNAVQFAEKTYAVQFPHDLDIAILNAYPKDTELLQIENAFIAYRSGSNLVKENGVVVVTAACRRGMGQHGMFGPGMPLYHKPQPLRFLNNRHLIVYAAGATAEEFYSLFRPEYSFYRQWQGVVDELQQKYPHPCTVGIIPCACLQMSGN